MYNYDPWCQLCEKLHDPNEPIKIYPDMFQWFYYDQNHVPLCSDGSEESYFPSMFGADAKQVDVWTYHLENNIHPLCIPKCSDFLARWYLDLFWFMECNVKRQKLLQF